MMMGGMYYNPYDEYAVEEAIQIRDTHGGEITVISVGTEESSSTKNCISYGSRQSRFDRYRR